MCLLHWLLNGKERLAGCLGITPLQAGQFIESFLVKYKKIHDFTKKTIEQCHNEGYVVSIMGRKRHLPNINARDYRLRAQAERQAVNFVVQGSAADLCKMAMVEIFTSVAISPTLTARFIAQIHDELLFEVEDSQIQEFSATQTPSPRETKWSHTEFEDLDSEIDDDEVSRYITLKLMKNEDEQLLEWWRQHKHNFPLLS
ncbi:unnamed protein product [Caretta caretta]